MRYSDQYFKWETGEIASKMTWTKQRTENAKRKTESLFIWA